MKVGIIGSSGQLGHDLMRVFGNDAVGYTHKELDITDVASLEKIKDVDYVINTAAYHKFNDCESNPIQAMNINTMGQSNVVKRCEKIGAVPVYISTDYVFSGKEHKQYDEDAPPSPINIYGLTKLGGELYTTFGNTGFTTIGNTSREKKYYIFRVSSLFGLVGPSGKGSNFVDAITKKAKSGEKIQVVDDIVMTPTYTLDAANVIASVLRKREEYGIYHASNEGMCSWFEFAKEIVNQLSLNVEVEPSKNTQPNRPAYTPLKSRKVKNRPWKDALTCYLKEKGHL